MKRKFNKDLAYAAFAVLLMLVGSIAAYFFIVAFGSLLICGRVVF